MDTNWKLKLVELKLIQINIAYMEGVLILCSTDIRGYAL